MPNGNFITGPYWNDDCQIALEISLREQVHCCPPYPADVRIEDKQDAYCPTQLVQTFADVIFHAVGILLYLSETRYLTHC